MNENNFKQVNKILYSSQYSVWQHNESNRMMINKLQLLACLPVYIRNFHVVLENSLHLKQQSSLKGEKLSNCLFYFNLVKLN
jgi:hypothetical protein